MLALPFVFAIFIVNFEAGLILYWITTNVWTIGRPLLVKKLYPKPAPREPSDDDVKPAARGSVRRSRGRREASRQARRRQGGRGEDRPGQRRQRARARTAAESTQEEALGRRR